MACAVDVGRTQETASAIICRGWTTSKSLGLSFDSVRCENALQLAKYAGYSTMPHEPQRR